MKSLQHFSWTRRTCYLGYITQAITINFSPLLFLTFQATFHITLTQISLLIAINFAVQLFTDLTVAKIIDRISLRRSAVAGQCIAAAGLISMAFLPFLLPNPFAGLIISILLCGIGGALNEVLISPIIEACPGEEKASSMSLLHSFYCWGQAGVILLSVIFFAVFGIEHWRILSCLLAVCPLIGALLFCQVPLIRPESERGAPLRHLFSVKCFFWLLLMMLAGGAAEMIMSQWASAFAEMGLGVSKSMGDLLGPCLFALTMGTSRLIYAKIAGRVKLLPVMAGSAALCVISYLMAALATLPMIALLSCGLCGLSVGIFWPGIYSLAAERLPKGGVPMFAVLAIAGDLGCLMGPSTAGRIADRFNGDIRLSFLLTAALPVVIILSTGILHWISSKNKTK